MKKLATLIALLPGMSMAHGVHAPIVDPSLHSASHAAPGVAALIMVVALGLLWRVRQ